MQPKLHPQKAHSVATVRLYKQTQITKLDILFQTHLVAELSAVEMGTPDLIDSHQVTVVIRRVHVLCALCEDKVGLEMENFSDADPETISRFA